jgi:Zn-dependent protease/CBS domain-containing protein
MKWSLYIGKISGIKMYIHWTFFFFLAWIIAGNVRTGFTLEQSIYSIGFILSIFVCITLHEFGHALTAKKYGYKTRDITLLPIGGMARMEQIPENPKHELVVAIAGPVVNVVIAALIGLGLFAGGNTLTFNMAVSSVTGFFQNLMWVNLSLAIFNLIPAFPMDGGRILRAGLTMATGKRAWATKIASTAGKVVAVIFFIIGIFGNPVLAVIGVFIFITAHAENEMVRTKSLLQDGTVSDVVMKRFFTVESTDTIEQAAKLLLDVQVTDFIVMENEKVSGTLNQQEIIRALAQKGKNVPVSTAMNTNVHFLKPDMTLEKIYAEFSANGKGIMPVMEGDKLIGIVDINNILEYVMVKSATERTAA